MACRIRMFWYEYKPPLGFPLTRICRKRISVIGGPGSKSRFRRPPYICQNWYAWCLRSGSDPSDNQAPAGRHRVHGVLKSAILILTASAALPVSSQPTATDRSIALYQKKAPASASDPLNYDRLGAAYLQKGRETSDFAYYELAEKALTKSIEIASPLDLSTVAPLTHLADVYMGEHRFTDAAQFANQAAALGSGDLSPFAILGDAHADMGDYEEAYAFYEKLLIHYPSQQPSRTYSYMHDSRVSYLRFVRGDTPGAIDLVQRALSTATQANMPAENVAWTYFQLGEYLYQSGDLSGAEAAYQQALNRYPGYYRGLSGMAKVRVAQQRYQDAIELYRKTIDTIPVPEYVAALGDLYWKTGQRQEAKKQYDLVEYIGYLNGLNAHTYNRELAVFYADHDMKLKESLDLAQKELEVRRDVYTQDVLAWSLYKGGKTKDASIAMGKALARGTKDPLFFFHAGLIQRDLGNVEGAQEYLSHALAINPQFHVFYADQARQVLEQISAHRTARKLDGNGR